MNRSLIKVLKNTSTFSFSEICQILEVNNVKLFSIALVDSSNKDIEAIVSVDTEDLTTALRLLREFEYEVLSNHEEDDFFK